MGSMYMSEGLLEQDLMSTAYKKFWPVTSATNKGREGRNNMIQQRQR